MYNCSESLSGTSQGIMNYANKKHIGPGGWNHGSDNSSMPSLTGQEKDAGTSSSDMTADEDTADEDSNDDQILLYKQCCL